MNSSVKQSQKDGATVEDISAGLSISVVKNAIYKVIRAGSADELGEHIVVQGGTFYNDAVLRAFELELGRNVIRPAIAGLMGAYGAALYAMDLEQSTLITREGLEAFTHTAKAATCQGCANHCRLTINIFGGGKQFISGNQCQKGLGLPVTSELPNLYAWKRDALTALAPGEGARGTIGLPLALGMYELLPLWHAFFRTWGSGWRSAASPPGGPMRRGSSPSPRTPPATPPRSCTATWRSCWSGGWTPSSTPASPTTWTSRRATTTTTAPWWPTTPSCSTGTWTTCSRPPSSTPS